MKIYKFTIRAIILLITLWLFAQGSFAYAPETTHPGLTQEILSYYEQLNKGQFTPDESALLIQGSTDEDNPLDRCLFHFYDPISGKGLNGNKPSFLWATSDLSGNEFTWSNGIEAYANGDERMAMVTLGHILHLIEDASVPDHTRNDSHKGDGLRGLYTHPSPFEDWTKANKDRDTLGGVGAKLAREGVPINTCTDIRACFLFMATYSNGNFFSRDTINETSFQSPVQTSEDNYYGYGIDSLSGQENKLFMRTLDKDNHAISILTDGQDYSVISENFDRLAPEVITVGARVIELFMTEAKFARAEQLAKEEEARKQAVAEQVALNNRLGNAGFFGQVAFGFTDIFISTPLSAIEHAGSKLASAYGGVTHIIDVAEVGFDYNMRFAAESTKLGNEVVASVMKEKAVAGVARTVVVAQKTGDKIQVGVNSAVSEAERLAELWQQLAMAQRVLLAVVNASNTSSEITPVSEVAGASTEKVSYVVDANSLSSGGGGNGGGGDPVGGPSTVIFLADASARTLPPIPDATTTEEDLEQISPLPPDAPIFLSPSDDEVLATTTVTLSGSAGAGLIVALSWEFVDATVVFETRASSTGEWSASVLLPVGATTIGAVSVGENDLVSSTTLHTVIITLPVERVVTPTSRVIFNEIGWSGTDASSSDEWIELHNAGDASADLSHYSLNIRDATGTVSIALSGVVGAGEYFVVTKEDVFTDMVPLRNELADEKFMLADDGAELSLTEMTDAGEVDIDRLPLCADWCGFGGEGHSMERWRTDRETAAWSNWGENDGNFMNGLDRDGNWVYYGTPGVRNSLNYLLSLTDTIEGLQSFSKGAGVYVIFSTLTIPADASLTLGAGTVVKWQAGGNQLIVSGSLSAMGTSEQPVIFTSVYDDTIEGDTFDDGDYVENIKSIQNGISLSGASSTILLVNTEIRDAGTALVLDQHASGTLIHVTLSDVTNDGIVLFASSTLLAEDVSLLNIADDGILGFGNSLVSATNLSLTNIGDDALLAFDGSSFVLASTTLRAIGGDGVDIFAGTIDSTDLTINGIHGRADAIGLYSSRGIPSTGTFGGLTITDVGTGSAIGLYGSSATVTDAYMVGGDDDGVELYNGSTLSLSSSTVSNFVDAAILSFNSTVDVASSTILSSENGIESWNSSVTIHDSTIAGNTGFGVINQTGETGEPVDATGNYWGDLDGPTTPEMFPEVEGDMVSDGVVTDPFLDADPTGSTDVVSIITPIPMLM